MAAVAELQPAPALPARPRRQSFGNEALTGAPVNPEAHRGRALCAALGLEEDMAAALGQVGTTQIRLRKGGALFRTGDRFSALYVIRSGSCKTVLLSECGANQVSGYHMPRDVLGIGGIDRGTHDCDAIALEVTEAFVLPFDGIETALACSARLQQRFLCLLSREITRHHNALLLLGTMRSEQRLAAYLLDLAQRYQSLGYSSSEFVLRMSREEIGSYLGLTLETVSRVCTRLQRRGMVRLDGRAVTVLDRVALKHLLTDES